MPSMVREVSAMLVASTTLRAPGGVGSKILACTFENAHMTAHAAVCLGYGRAFQKVPGACMQGWAGNGEAGERQRGGGA